MNTRDEAFLVEGGSGDDTLRAASQTFTENEFEFLVLPRNFETVIDSTGIYDADNFGIV